MIRRSAFFKPFAAAALLALGGASQAAITAYTTLAAFTAATTAQGTDSFSGVVVGAGMSGPVTRSAGAYGYLASATPAGMLYGAGTSSNPWLSTDDAMDSITFSGFTGNATAAGGNFFVSDVSGLFIAGNVLVTATDASGSFTQTISSAQLSSFLGFTSSTGITSLTVSSVQTGAGFLWPTVDNLVLAQALAVPEPGTYLMMLAGLGLLGAAARKRSG